MMYDGHQSHSRCAARAPIKACWNTPIWQSGNENKSILSRIGEYRGTLRRKSQYRTRILFPVTSLDLRRQASIYGWTPRKDGISRVRRRGHHPLPNCLPQDLLREKSALPRPITIMSKFFSASHFESPVWSYMLRVAYEAYT